MGGRSRRGSSGQSTVEFGISSIALLLLLMGLLDLARGFYFAVRLQDAAREGARYGITYCATCGTTTQYPHLDDADIKTAVDNVLTSAGLPASTLANPGTTCPSTQSGDPLYNPPYRDSAYPTAVGQPELYICYELAPGTEPPLSTPTASPDDLLVAVLYRYGLTSGFLQNQLGIASVKLVGTYHALIP